MKTLYTASEIEEYAYNGAQQTLQKCYELEKQGYQFVPGNNPRMDKTKKWANYDLIRVAQTNSRNHGKCVQTLWAAKKLEAACR